MKKRRKFAPEFKAKVALEALAGELTLAELAAKHDVHPNVIQQWRRQAKEGLPDVFSGKASARPGPTPANGSTRAGARVEPRNCVWPCRELRSEKERPQKRFRPREPVLCHPTAERN